LLATLPASTERGAFCAKWDPAGRFLAVGRSLDAGSRLTELEVWDVPDRRRVLLLHDVRSGSFSFHPRHQRLLASVPGKAVSVWALDRGAEVARIPLPGDALHLAFSPDGGRFAALLRPNRGWVLSVHDAQTGALCSSTYFDYEPRAFDW